MSLSNKRPVKNLKSAPGELDHLRVIAYSQLSPISQNCLRLQLHGAIYRPDSFVLMLRHCGNLKAIRYESTSLNRIVADKSHLVILAL